MRLMADNDTEYVRFKWQNDWKLETRFLCIFSTIRHSLSEILEHVRLEAVCRKLLETTWSIDKIAMHEGFSSGSYLHAVFRKRYGYTPSTYRAKNVKV